MEPENAVVRSYRISPVRRSVMWWLLGPFVLLGLGIFIFADADKRGAGMLIMLLMAPWLAWWHWYTGRLRLEVSREGVTHRQGRLVLQAKWPQIERARLDRAREGLVVREPMEGRAADRLVSIRGMWLSGVPLYDEEQQRLMGERRLIPIDPFAYLLRNGRLLADFDEFAPELGRAIRADMEERALLKRLPKPPATPQEQMKRFWLFLLIATMMGLGVWAAVAPDSVVARATDRLMLTAVGLCLPVGAFLSAWSSRNSFRKNSRLLGVLFALGAVVQALLALVVWAEIARGNRNDKPAAAPTSLQPNAAP